MDTKLALGLARSDARRLSRSIDGKMKEFASSVFGIVSARFDDGRRLSPGDLKAMIAETDRIVGTDMFPILCRSHFRPPTRTRPKGEAYERLSLHVIPNTRPEGQTFEIWAFRLIASARRVVCDTMHTGLQFHLHTVQRVIERSDNVEPDNAPVAATARAILTHSGRLFAALEASKTRNCDLSFGIPFGPGMLAGTIEEESLKEDETGFARTCMDAAAAFHRTMDHPFLGGAPGNLRKITLRTYIPGELLRPRQASYTDKWDDLRYDHPVLEQSSIGYYWPTRQLWNPENVDPNPLAAARKAVHDLVFDPSYWNDGSKRTKYHTPTPIAPHSAIETHRNEVEPEDRGFALSF